MDNNSKAEINKLFLEYRRTFESGDAQQVAEFYRFPLHYYAEHGSKAVVSRRDFVGLVEKLLRLYRHLGVQQIVGTVSDQMVLNRHSNLVSLNWILLRSEGEKTVQLYDAGTRYLVVETADGPRIDALFAGDETTKLRHALRTLRRPVNR
ncbi:hypothetical protein AWR36_011085 [Microbulbifer flavimaris]|uniref:Nuclear transport factor 2 family protein n=1 Tax=Microbulbifer flavimaris TaxID=1781068 RepID=A0ABX4HZN1_9GAMM|nr:MULTISPECIES: hypothetical protein [Microbulbifer]KUJ83072.1 hypothetical protein AVO43_11065 [Microbulbifer sp. ZGT114]PCO05258.1 hypothetical protein AWR36_011085 [Microbulbifer flavimaris]